jgi:DedD protein
MATLWEEKLEFPDASEVHWSTRTIMTVFIAASLISAVFFGLGYSFGRGGTSKATLNTSASQITNSPAFASEQPPQQSTIKPVLRQVATLPTPIPLRAADPGATAAFHSSQSVLHSVEGSVGQRAMPTLAQEHQQPRLLEQGRSARQAVESSAFEGSHYMVQVGAVADHKDAQTLVSQLRRRGFHARIYSAKHDKFLHVQIGPFTNAHQAETMRHHVLASGYHAILKRAS